MIGSQNPAGLVFDAVSHVGGEVWSPAAADRICRFFIIRRTGSSRRPRNHDPKQDPQCDPAPNTSIRRKTDRVLVPLDRGVELGPDIKQTWKNENRLIEDRKFRPKFLLPL